MRRVYISVVVVLLLSLKAYGFQMPETLEYELKWMGLTAGYSKLSVSESEGQSRLIASSADSASWVSIFFPVEDRIISLIGSGESWLPARYHMKVREGDHRKDKESIFERDNFIVHYTDYLKNEKKQFSVPEDVYDPISAFYSVRWMPFVAGTSIYVNIFDNKRVWNVQVIVIGKERVSVPAGTFDTFLISPLMKSEGIFKSKGPIYIWLTDDEKRIPVKLSTKAPVGTITAVLTGGDY